MKYNLHLKHDSKLILGQSLYNHPVAPNPSLISKRQEGHNINGKTNAVDVTLSKESLQELPIPSISRATPADIEKVGIVKKTSKVDWKTVGLFILISCIFTLH